MQRHRIRKTQHTDVCAIVLLICLLFAMGVTLGGASSPHQVETRQQQSQRADRSSEANENAVQPKYRYYYFDEPRTLILNERRIALRSTDEHMTHGTHWLDDFGLNDHAMSDHVIPEWYLADLGDDLAHHDAVRHLVRDITDQEHAAFASPVLINPSGGPIILSSDILVRFHTIADFTAQQAEDVFNERGLDILDADWASMDGAETTNNHRS